MRKKGKAKTIDMVEAAARKTMAKKADTVIRKKKRIGELLIEAGIIGPKQLEEALTIQGQEGGKIVEILVNLGYASAEDVAQFLSGLPGTPSIELSNYRIARELCELIPRDFALKNEVFPVDRLGKLLTVGMAFPIDAATISELEEMTQLRVKAFLCRAKDIQNAIAQHYASESVKEDTVPEIKAQQIEVNARLKSVASLLREIDSLPTLPQTVQRVQEAAASPGTHLMEIARIVSEDPAISAKLLQLANSAAYGFAHTVSNVELATTLLGLKEICMVVTSSAIIDLTEKSHAFDHRQFWSDSMFRATAAKQIAGAIGEKRRHSVFTAALLCDIGCFALAEAAPARYEKIDDTLKGQDLIDAEEEILGIGHPEAGYILAMHWNLPDEITEPIRFHQSPQYATDCKKLVAMVSVAAHLTELHRSDQEVDADGLTPCSGSLDTLGLTVEGVIALYAELCAVPV